MPDDEPRDQHEPTPQPRSAQGRKTEIRVPGGAPREVGRRAERREGTHRQAPEGRGRRAVVRTWLILVGLMLAYVVWFGAIYLLEPGIR